MSKGPRHLQPRLSKTGDQLLLATVGDCYSGMIAPSDFQRGHMRRREFIMLLGGTAAASPLPSRAEQSKAIPRVGVLWHAANAVEEAEYLGALTKAFRELGYVEGKNIE